jgi:hypothetical protein
MNFLYTHLDDVYQKRSRSCVMFISQHYRDKVWTSHERSSAQARALASAGEYVLPARFDDTEIPGVRPTVAYLDLRTLSPDDVAKAILVKLGRQTELDEMVEFLTNYLGSYEVTIEGTDLHLRSEEEQFEASFPIRLLLEMYRVNQLENMFLLPGLLPH